MNNREAEAIDLLCDCVAQYLHVEDGIVSHSCMSTDERLCDFLVSVGRLERIADKKFRFVEEERT